MKIGQIVAIRKAIIAHKSEVVNAITAYKFVKFLKQTEAEAEFFQTSQSAIINKFCERTEDGEPFIDGGSFTIPAARVGEYNTAIKEVEDTDAVCEATINFTLAELEKIEFSTAEMYAMYDLIEQEDKTE